MRPPVRPPRLRCALFPLTYPPHLLVLPATFGLHLFWQTYPYFRALYVISVRRTKGLPTASFRFHLTMDTLAVQLYTSSLPRRVRDFHPLERAHGAQTKKTGNLFLISCLGVPFLCSGGYSVLWYGCSSKRNLNNAATSRDFILSSVSLSICPFSMAAIRIRLL